MPDPVPREPLRVALLGCSLETGNWGINALAWGTVRALLRRNPDARVYLLDYGRTSRTYGGIVDGGPVTCRLINLRFSWKLILPNNVFRLLASAALRRVLHVRTVRGESPLATLAAMDAALAISGGDSFSDLYGLRRLLYVALPQILSILAGVPLVQLPQTYGPFRTAPGRWVAGWILRRSVRVYARDPGSLETARRLAGVAANNPMFRLTCDMAFALESTDPGPDAVSSWLLRRGQRPLVGFNVSGLLVAGGYHGSNDYRLLDPFATSAAQAVRALVRERACDVLLVPHVVTPGGVEDDLAASRALRSALPEDVSEHVRILDADMDQGGRKHVIGRCDAFIGSRMHTCIAALSQGVPTLGLAYSDKFSGVFGAIPAGAEVVDLRQATWKDLVERCLALVDARCERRALLVPLANDLCSKALSFFADLPLERRREETRE